MSDAPAPSLPVVGAAVLRAMAEKLDTNRENGFGGCFLLIPPDGTIKELMLLNNSPDLAMFWSLVQTTAQIALQELQDDQRQTTTFGRR